MAYSMFGYPIIKRGMGPWSAPPPTTESVYPFALMLHRTALVCRHGMGDPQHLTLEKRLPGSCHPSSPWKPTSRVLLPPHLEDLNKSRVLTEHMLLQDPFSSVFFQPSHCSQTSPREKF